MPANPLTYVEFAPGGAVRDLALTYWGLTVGDVPLGDQSHELRPDGCLIIALAMHDGEAHATIIGPRRKACALPLHSNMQYWGVRFRPEMGAAFLGRPARMLRDQIGLAHHWMGAEPLRMLALRVTSALSGFKPLSVGAEVEAAVGLALDRWLFDSADTTMPPERAVRDAIRVIVATEGNQPVAVVASLCGVSPRHLQRCFKDAVGLTPKEYAMLRRDCHADRHNGQRADSMFAGLSGPAAYSAEDEREFLRRDVERLLHGTSEALERRLKQIKA